jgi:hypothetical protein
MGQFMGQQASIYPAGTGRHTRREADVRTDGEGRGPQLGAPLLSGGIEMEAHSSEVATEARLEEGPFRCR